MPPDFFNRTLSDGSPNALWSRRANVSNVVAGWALMIVAMMFPLLVPMIEFVAARNFVVRRERSVALFIAGYGIVWLTTAASASAALVIARAGLAGLGLAAVSGFIGCALAALWQISPAKQLAVYRCHGTIALQPFGFAADRAAIRFGLLHGARCMRSCLPTMALPLLGDHGLLAMAVVFVIPLAERASIRPQYGLSAVVLLTLGATRWSRRRPSPHFQRHAELANGGVPTPVIRQDQRAAVHDPRREGRPRRMSAATTGRRTPNWLPEFPRRSCSETRPPPCDRVSPYK